MKQFAYRGALWAAIVLLTVQGLRAQGPGLEYHVRPPAAPPGTPTKLLRLRTGAPVLVAEAPAVRIGREDVARIEGVVTYRAVRPDAPERSAGMASYRVVLRLTKEAEESLQAFLARVCVSDGYIDLVLSVDDVVLNDTSVLGCPKVEAGATFLDRSDAEAFARHFTDKSIEFVEPTPTQGPMRLGGR